MNLCHETDRSTYTAIFLTDTRKLLLLLAKHLSRKKKAVKLELEKQEVEFWLSKLTDKKAVKCFEKMYL